MSTTLSKTFQKSILKQAYFEYEGVVRRCADELEGLEVGVREGLGPVALAADDEHGEEVGEAEQRQHQLGVRPGSVRHRRALQVAAFDPLAEVVQPIHGLQLSWCQPAWLSASGEHPSAIQKKGIQVAQDCRFVLR